MFDIKLEGQERVESLIRSKLSSDAPLLEEIPKYLLDLGGKRVRPLLTLLTAKALGMEPASQHLVDVAAGIELIHMATLLHDDIIDNSPLRRHKKSAYMKYGTANTLLSGDFLLVRAFSLCAKLDAFIINATERACIELTEGEIMEVPLHKETHTLETSLSIARKKTASLFRLATESAAHIVSPDNKELVKVCAAFGENLGVAFQILDDILDIVSDEDLLGKKSGMDLIERKPSVVNVLWLKRETSLSKALLSDTKIDDEYVLAARQEIMSSSVIQEAKEMALSYAGQAKNNLKTAQDSCKTPDVLAFQNLQNLIEFTTQRLA